MLKNLVENQVSQKTHLAYQEEPLYVNDQSYIVELKSKYKRNQTIKFKCPKCGNESIKQLRTIKSYPFYCTTCNNNMTRPSNIEKCKMTKMMKYGDPYYCNLEKRKQTIENGIGWKSMASRAAESRKANSKNDPNHEQNIQLKRRETIIQKYGSWDNYVLQSKSKGDETRFKKYGDAHYNNQNKRHNTMLSNGGISNNKYKYCDETFDSSWELVYYVYCLENQINIVRNHTKYFLYSDTDGKTHKYFPDFYVNGKYVEIKGNQFFKDGDTTKVFDKSNWSCKLKCMTDHNVTLLTYDKLQDAFNYVADKFTNGSKKKLFRHWCKSFIIKKPTN